MKLGSHALILTSCLAGFLALSSSTQAETTIVTGEHWVESSAQLKKAYLLGVANVLDVEHAYYGSNPPSDKQSFIPRTIKGLTAGRYNLDSVLQALDAWYAQHPDKLQRPILETIWFEMVVPGLAKAK